MFIALKRPDPFLLSRVHATATVGLAPTRRNRFGVLDIANAARARHRDGWACPDTSQQVWCARHRERRACTQLRGCYRFSKSKNSIIDGLPTPA
jgi:hypothetical protein